MSKKAIIFDLDGTLWDSTDATYTSINTISKKYNCGEISKELVIKNFGNNRLEASKLFFPHLEQEKAFKILEEAGTLIIETLSKNGGFIYSGLEEVLFDLHQKYDLYIVSNTGRKEYIEVFLITSKLFKYFKDYIAASKTMLSKGDAIIKIIDDYYIEGAVYVGDTVKDKNAAEIANIPFIQCLYGFGENLGCKYKIKDISELPEQINKIFKDYK